jgi:hypothetical protein
VSCSWCHELNEVECGNKVYCVNCGHRADVSRFDCDCQQCRRTLSIDEVLARAKEVGT